MNSLQEWGYNQMTGMILDNRSTFFSDTRPLYIDKADKILFREMFPLIAGLSKNNMPSCNKSDSTTYTTTDILKDELTDRLDQAYSYAKMCFEGLDQEQLMRAYQEAKRICSCSVFEDGFMPSIFVDSLGEFTISHKSAFGYIDIGVSGDKTLSYGIRNDSDPEKSINDDLPWDDYSIPTQLIDALKEIKSLLLS